MRKTLTMWIQTLIRATMVAFLIASFQSCDKDGKVDACGVGDPLEDLAWLADIKKSIEANTYAAQITMYTYQGQQIFFVEECMNCTDGLIEVYSCEGEEICVFGGIGGLNTCPDFWQNATDPVILYSNQCDQLAIPDATKYQQESAFHSIISASITGDCLTIEFSASGCSGESWRYELIDAEEILESAPIQRNIRLLLENQEACAAVFTRTASFDLRPLRDMGSGEIRFNLAGHSEQLSYTY